VGRVLLALSAGALSPQALRMAVNITHRATFRANYLQPALKRGLVERTIPGRPSSRLQKYRLTEKGRAWLASGKSGA
jgi:DNA-binding PadR family transcriptional regulator